MGSLSPERYAWVIRPLIDAGLDRERITELMFQLGFEAIVSEGRGAAAWITTPVSGEPANVRAAWTEVIDRMLSPDRENA